MDVELNLNWIRLFHNVNGSCRSPLKTSSSVCSMFDQHSFDICPRSVSSKSKVFDPADILFFRLLFNNWFMLSVRISSYGCTREVWRTREKRKSCSRHSREQL